MVSSEGVSINDQNGEIILGLDGMRLEGEWSVPPQALGLVLFAHGSGSGRRSPRNQRVAQILRQSHIGTLLFDLLTRREELEDDANGRLRFDVPLLARRLLGATDWCHRQRQELPLGYFGSSTGAGAAVVAAALARVPIAAIVSRGGRPDLAGGYLEQVKAPTLLLVGSKDTAVIELNRQALEVMTCARELKLVEGATHLFEEPGTLETVAETAAQWFVHYFRTQSPGV